MYSLNDNSKKYFFGKKIFVNFNFSLFIRVFERSLGFFSRYNIYVYKRI